MILKEQIIRSFVLLSVIVLYSHKPPRPKPASPILYQVNFEEKNPIPSFLTTQSATPYGIQIVEKPVYEGKQAARFELRDSDPENKHGTRAEISFPAADKKTSIERWYAFAVFFPRDDFDFDERDEVISQWHQGGKATPSLCIRTMANKIRLRITPLPKTKTWKELGPIEKNVWQYYVMHIKHSAGADGLVEIWRNGVRVVHYTGANMYDLNSGVFHSPNWKLGIYKSAWNGSGITKAQKRVLYMDAIKIGDARACFSDMGK